MELVDMWHQQTQQRYSDDADRQAEFERFKKTHGYQECLQTGKERAAADIDGIWEAVGLNGVVYPFPTADTDKSFSQQRDYDIYLGHCFGRHALRGDATAIGTLVLEQLHAYIMREADRFVEDNWEQWK